MLGTPLCSSFLPSLSPHPRWWSGAVCSKLVFRPSHPGSLHKQVFGRSQLCENSETWRGDNAQLLPMAGDHVTVGSLDRRNSRLLLARVT